MRQVGETSLDGSISNPAGLDDESDTTLSAGGGVSADPIVLEWQSSPLLASVSRTSRKMRLPLLVIGGLAGIGLAGLGLVVGTPLALTSSRPAMDPTETVPRQRTVTQADEPAARASVSATVTAPIEPVAPPSWIVLPARHQGSSAMNESAVVMPASSAALSQPAPQMSIGEIIQDPAPEPVDAERRSRPTASRNEPGSRAAERSGARSSSNRQWTGSFFERQ